MAKKKTKHSYVITDTDFNGNPNENAVREWCAECVADYFYMDKLVKSEDDEVKIPFYINYYYRGNTRMEVRDTYKRIKYFNERTNTYCLKNEWIEVMNISKRNKYGDWIEIYSTTSMDEICILFEDYNTFYYTMGWQVPYEQYEWA